MGAASRVSQGVASTLSGLPRMWVPASRLARCCILLAGLLPATSPASAQRPVRPTARSLQASVPPPVRKDSSVIEIYGLMLGDIGHDFMSNDPQWFDVNRPSKLPAFRDEFGFAHRTWTSARGSTFGVKSVTRTPRGDIRTTFEFDLLGLGPDAGNAAFDPRLAYGEWRGFGAGLADSPFTDASVLPKVLEQWGPNGLIYLQNPQIFWKARNDSVHEFIIALAKPDGNVDSDPFEGHVDLKNVSLRFPAPAVSAAYKRKWKSGYLRVAGVVRSIRWDDVLPGPLEASGGATTWGAALSSNVRPTERDVLRLQVSGGMGVESFYNDAPIDIGPERVLGDPRRLVAGVPLPILGVVAYLEHGWNDVWSSTAGYSRVAIGNSDAQVPASFRIGQYATANLVATPAGGVIAGAELQWARRRNFRDGWTASDMRIQVSIRYRYSRRF